PEALGFAPLAEVSPAATARLRRPLPRRPAGAPRWPAVALLPRRLRVAIRGATGRDRDHLPPACPGVGLHPRRREAVARPHRSSPRTDLPQPDHPVRPARTRASGRPD